MKIVILDGHTENPGDLSWAPLEELGELTVYERTPIDDPEEIVRRVADNEVVITNKTPLTREILERCPSVRFITLFATGYNVVDVEAARERGIPVSNVPGYSTAAVAQFTMALLLHICCHTALHSDSVHAGRWAASVDFCYWDAPLIELAGKTVGIIGFGSIGKQFGRIAKAMGMNVIAAGSRPTPEGEAIGTYVALDELYRRSDVISLHCPLFPETQGMIDAGAIGKMKDGVILLNTARGGLVDEKALADALNSGKVYAAGVDVVSAEPIRADNPLLGAKNCVITPHIAWAPKECRARVMDVVAENIRAYRRGAAQNVVNP